ncbi:3-dehydroquinate synthase [Chloroflexota bacterium]
MRTIRVDLGKNGYEIRIGAGVLAQTGHWLKELGFSGKLVIITDDTVKDLYGDDLQRHLAGEGLRVTTLSVPAGEDQKSLETAGQLYQELTRARAERTTPILTLGGGVIGDLAGFVAATFMRGIPLVQIPTTLLAQVDSSIGGKVAVDYGQLKNMIGVFYQPQLVIADTATLKTLPDSEMANGLAEVIKSAAIRDGKLFDYLEENLEKVKTLGTEVTEEIVSRTAGIKAGVVAADEKDTGLRNILNYGHTIGHAIETVSDFRISHGHAVALGMVAAARISCRLGMLTENEVSRLQRLIESAGLPATMPELSTAAMIETMQHDKKVKDDKTRFVLLKGIGNAVVTDNVNPALLAEVLSREA